MLGEVLLSTVAGRASQARRLTDKDAAAQHGTKQMIVARRNLFD
jgi:hypothetical protein